MRSYVDLNIKKELFEKASIEFAGAELKKAGFKTIALSICPTTKIKEISKIKEKLNEVGIDVATRIDIEPRSRSELLKFLRKNRKRYEVIGVRPYNKETAITSARDRRVDAINYDLKKREVTFRESTAHVCINSLEIQVLPLIQLFAKESIYQVMTRILNEVTVAKKHQVPIIITSCAGETSEIRAAKDMAALPSCLGLKIEEALDTVSDNPMSIISENRLKLSESYIMEGVKV